MWTARVRTAFCRGAVVSVKARQRMLAQRVNKNCQHIKQQAAWDAWLQAIGMFQAFPWQGSCREAQSTALQVMCSCLHATAMFALASSCTGCSRYLSTSAQGSFVG